MPLITKKALLGSCLAISMALAPTLASATTLSLVSWMKDDPSYGPWWQAVIDKFQETHPGDTIDWTKVDRSSYATTMYTMFAADSPPDIVHLASFEYQAFANEGWLENLDPWIEKAGMNLDGWAGQSTCQWNGETNCIMLLYTGYVLAYNEKLLKDAGIDKAPTTAAEFLAAAQATTKDTDGDGVTDQYGVGLPAKDKAGLMYGVLGFTLDAGGRFTDADGNPTFDSAPVIDGLTKIKQIYDDGLMPKEQSSGDIRQLFSEGKIAMTVDGPWIYGTMQSASDEEKPNLKLTMPPFAPPVGGTSNVIGMPSDLAPEKKQLVWEFIQIATSQEFQQKFAEIAKQPAPMPGLDYSAQIAADPNFALFIKSNEAASAANVDRLPKGLEVQFNQVQDIFFQNLQRMFIENLDPAQAAKNIQDEVVAIE